MIMITNNSVHREAVLANGVWTHTATDLSGNIMVFCDCVDTGGSVFKWSEAKLGLKRLGFALWLLHYRLLQL
ncbi:hypothetical protein GALMADRAFT_251602 [Galerina marginata CBS 339.88]|uniref:Uncharacterized protein n=1 Tax=Galerina marginata (strain CBS 339.88) TaxID=685588 RepID=A0A067T441_GALM3|nr:hypothetical protein GALMADRAFT_251602 [Galerina marginata CBS 339.88]